MSNRNLEEISRYFWHPMQSPKTGETMPKFLIDHGEGIHVFDLDGKKMIDGVSGMWCVNVGHRRREIIDAIMRQLEKLAYCSTFANRGSVPPLELASKLIEMLAPEDMAHVMFSSGGSDANETALKLTRQYWKLRGEPMRTKLISLRGGYHGVHFGGMSVSGPHAFRDAYEPVLPGCIQIEAPDLYRGLKEGDDPEVYGNEMAAFLEREIIHHGQNSVAAFIMEPVLGAGAGVVVPPANYMRRVREICDRYDVLLVADEVITGFGRTGSMFGSRHWGVKPDIMCLAKGINSGYVPLGATVVNRKVAAAWSGDEPLASIMHGYTYSGHPVACAAALANLEIVEKEDLPGNAGKVGAHMLKRLQEFGEYPVVGNVRGLGLMMAIELVSDRATKTSFGDGKIAHAIALNVQRHGAIVRPSGSRIILAPPLILSVEQADDLLEAVHRGFKEFTTSSQAQI